MNEQGYSDYFSMNYGEARQRFRSSAQDAGAKLLSYPLAPDGTEDLTIDVATLGPDDAPALLISSGVHGVEGFFGSAVQLAFLDRLRRSEQPENIRYVLVHGINPYGFAHFRRFNEENIDLNRNFLLDDQDYAGAPDEYAQLDPFLNPASSPPVLEFFHLKAIQNILRHGFSGLKAAVAGGQYDFPNGLFFGGRDKAASTRIIEAECGGWLARSPEIVHIDFHSGLGKFADYRLLLGDASDTAEIGWYRQTFDGDRIEPISSGETAYRASGLFGDWMQARFADRHFRFVTAEFGTFNPVHVLKKLRAETRAHLFGHAHARRTIRAKKQLLDAFCPPSPRWRQEVVHASLSILDQAKTGLKRMPNHVDG